MDIEHPDHDPEIDLSAVERRLAAWRPTAGGLDRDRMLYEAGRAAARADGRVRSWRLATAALILMAVGLGGLLVRERSQRLALELSLALASQIKPQHPVGETALPTSRETAAIEPFAPTSYFALTSRLGQSILDMSSPGVEFEPKSHRPATGPSDLPPQRRPLQPRDLQRVLEL
jgi:hypothetical protein